MPVSPIGSGLLSGCSYGQPQDDWVVASNGLGFGQATTQRLGQRGMPVVLVQYGCIE